MKNFLTIFNKIIISENNWLNEILLYNISKLAENTLFLCISLCKTVSSVDLQQTKRRHAGEIGKTRDAYIKCMQIAPRLRYMEDFQSGNAKNALWCAIFDTKFHPCTNTAKNRKKKPSSKLLRIMAHFHNMSKAKRLQDRRCRRLD